MNARREPRHRSAVRWLLTTAWVACSFLTVVRAQELPSTAAEALGQAQRSAAAALIEYDTHTPDRPLWAEALRFGRAAADAAPNHPAPQRFLAQAYLQVGFYARSWEAWEAYLALGGTLDVVAERQVVEVVRWMGVAAYDGGRRDDAIPYFEALLEFQPFDRIANERLARTYLERGEPLGARPYLEALDGTIPDLADDLEYVQRLDQYGDAALQSFEAGRAAADAGDPATAIARYTDATRAAPGFVDAWRAIVDAALALGREDVAARAVDQLLTLAPNDPRGLSARATLNQADTARIAVEEAAAAAAAAQAEAAAARAAAQAEAARLAAEREATEAAARAAADARAAQETSTDAEAQAEADRAAAAEATRAAQAEADRIAAQEEAARVAAEQEAARIAAEEEAARIAAEQAAEQEAARVAAEQEAARAAAEREDRLAGAATLTLGDTSHVHRAEGGLSNPAIAYVAAPELRIDLTAHVSDVLHVRVTVVERAGDDPMWFQLCLVPPDVSVAPACTAADLVVLSTSGTYDASVRWRDLQGTSAVDWRNGIDALMWVLRRPDGTPVSGSGDDADRYLPTSLRVRAVAAPADASLPDGR